MSTTAFGFIVILMIGLVVLTIAALVDRRNRLIGEGRRTPRTTDIDEPSDDGQSGPTYMTTTELRRQSPALPPLDDAAQSMLKGGMTLALTLASPDLATNADRISLVPDVRVLVCDEPVTTVRELMPIWQALPPSQAVTIAAPAFDPDVIDVLQANLSAGTRLVQALLGDDDARRHLADLTGATPQPRPELQAGGVPFTALGHAAIIVASSKDTQVVV